MKKVEEEHVFCLLFCDIPVFFKHTKSYIYDEPRENLYNEAVHKIFNRYEEGILYLVD